MTLRPKRLCLAWWAPLKPRGHVVVDHDGVEPNLGPHLGSEMCDDIPDRYGRIAGIECIRGLLRRTELPLNFRQQASSNINLKLELCCLKLALMCLSRQREQPVLCGTPTMVDNRRISPNS
jgi:hypothetical protein